MRRDYALPLALVLLCAALLVMLWRPRTSSAQQQDSPIVVSDAGSIHFRRTVAGDVIQPNGPGWKVTESGRRVDAIDIVGGGSINLRAGWSVRLMDGNTEAGVVRSADNALIQIDPEGHAPAPAAPAAEVVIPQFHLRSIAVQNGGGGPPRTFTCRTSAECFRIHYK